MAAARQAGRPGRGQLSLPGGIDTHAPGPGDAADDAARGRTRGLPRSQPHRRDRRRAPGLPVLSAMGPLFSAYVLSMLLGIVFIPLFVIAFVVLRSSSRALVLAAPFTMGAILGFFLAV